MVLKRSLVEDGFLLLSRPSGKRPLAIFQTSRDSCSLIRLNMVDFEVVAILDTFHARELRLGERPYYVVRS